MKKRSVILVIAGCALVAAAAFVTVRHFTAEEKPRHIDVDRNAYPIKGIDISSHNGFIDFDAVVADSISFVYIKASEGDTFRDSLFNRNYAGATAVGLPVGAYHFFRFDCDGISQAKNMLAAVEGKPTRLPLAIDIEEWGNPNESDTHRIVDNVLAMVSVLHDNDRQVILYTNKKGYRRFVQYYLDKMPLWVCSFTDPPVDNAKWVLWQHSHRGRVKGISTDVDLNTFNGDSTQFGEWILSYNPDLRNSGVDVARQSTLEQDTVSQ